MPGRRWNMHTFQSSHTWYETAYEFKVTVGGGPAISNAVADDIPDDLRKFLIEWLGGENVGTRAERS